jgi:uncharacterized protein YfbU (UPF0304 family)
MELTEMERVNLIRQCTILKFLDVEQKDYWESAIEVFEKGSARYYSDYLPHLEEQPSADVYQLVSEIVDVHDSIEGDGTASRKIGRNRVFHNPTRDSYH